MKLVADLTANSVSYPGSTQTEYPEEHNPARTATLRRLYTLLPITLKSTFHTRSLQIKHPLQKQVSGRRAALV